jgi:hypothetical protein
MVVLDPIPVVITNFDELKKTRPDELTRIVHCFPTDPKSCPGAIQLAPVIYIDRTDFRTPELVDSNYYGLTVDKEVRLKYAFNLKCHSFTTGPGDTLCIYGTLDLDNEKKCKGSISWVSDDFIEIQVDHFLDTAFTRTTMNARAASYLEQWSVQIGESVQFERLGYYVKSQSKVWLQTTALRK